MPALLPGLHSSNWLLLTHLSYYILAHQIQVLRTYLSGNETRQPPRLSLAGAALHQMFKHFLIPQLLFFDLIFFWVQAKPKYGNETANHTKCFQPSLLLFRRTECLQLSQFFSDLRH